jgi:hypothetical protein
MTARIRQPLPELGTDVAAELAAHQVARHVHVTPLPTPQG